MIELRSRLRFMAISLLAAVGMLVVVFGFRPNTATAAPTAELAQQGFESGGVIGVTNWNYRADPLTYNTSGDVWAMTSTVGSIMSAAEGTQFWGMRDLDNPNGGGSFDHLLNFEPIDVSAETGVVLQITYNVDGYDSTDYLRYELYLDGAGQGDETVFQGQSGGASSNGWETLTVNIPDATNSVSVTLKARQNGGSDYAGWDDIKLISDFADTTPPTVVATDPISGAVAVLTDTEIVITFSEAVSVTAPWFEIMCDSSGAHTATVAPASPAEEFTLSLDVPFTAGESCSVSLRAANVADLAGNPMMADYRFEFTAIPLPPEGVIINEVRQDQEGADNDEYFELKGTPGTDLTGLTFVTIGDGAGLSGDVEGIVSLDGLVIPAGGYLLVAQDAFTTGFGVTPDLTVSLDFENGDNVTHLLAFGFSGDNNTDIDADDDGTVDAMPWAKLLDAVGIIHSTNVPTDTEYAYGAALGFVDVGPAPPEVEYGNDAPSHIFRVNSRADGDWVIGAHDVADPNASDTPRAMNGAAPTAVAISQSDAIGASAVMLMSLFLGLGLISAEITRRKQR